MFRPKGKVTGKGSWHERWHHADDKRDMEEFGVVEVDHDYRVVGFQEKLARLSVANI